jgi:hypothetical protein
MFEKLESCEILSLAFPHRLTPNAFCLALFIRDYHEGRIHPSSFFSESDGVPLFTTLFNLEKSDFSHALNELIEKGILFNDDEHGFWLAINENKF